MRGKPFLVRMMSGALLKPKDTILGADVAGRVEAVGPGVSVPPILSRTTIWEGDCPATATSSIASPLKSATASDTRFSRATPAGNEAAVPNVPVPVPME